MITPRMQVAQFVRDRIEGQDSVNLPDLTEAALGHFMRDPDWVEAFLRSQFSPMLYTIAQNVIAQRRSGQIIVGNVIASQQVAKQMVSRRPRWQMWLEHDGNEYVALPSMTREGLLRAADGREQRANREAGIASVWRALAANMQPGQRVADVYDEDAINAVVDQMQAGGVQIAMLPATPIAVAATTAVATPTDDQ